MNYHYTYIIDYARHSSTLGGADTLEGTMQRATLDLCYHRERHHIRSATIEIACKTCEGAGEIVRAHKYNSLRLIRKRCAAYRGKGVFSTVNLLELG